MIKDLTEGPAIINAASIFSGSVEPHAESVKQYLQSNIQSSPHSSHLTESEQRELQRNEEIIERGWQTFVEVGKALSQIRDLRLYRQNYKTFETYCRMKWQYGRHYANHLIAASEIVTKLIASGTTPPQHESQVRPLIGLPNEILEDVWNKAVAKANGASITSKIVRMVVSELHEKEGKRKSRVKPKEKNNPDAQRRDKILQLVRNAEYFLRSQHIENVGPILAEIRELALKFGGK